MKLIKLLIVLGVLAGAAYLISNRSGGGGKDEPAAKAKKTNGDGVRLEEKYGFTGQDPLP